MTLKRLRVDNVGSMLRPAALREAFLKYAEGGLSEEQLTHEQDEAIRAVIAHQEQIGFPSSSTASSAGRATWREKGSS